MPTQLPLYFDGESYDHDSVIYKTNSPGSRREDNAGHHVL